MAKSNMPNLRRLYTERSIAALVTEAAKSIGAVFAKEPPNVPIGVLARLK